MFDADPTVAIRHLKRVDKVLGRAIERAGEYVVKPARVTAFQALLKSIVYQQLSGRAAGTIHRRLLDLLPRNTQGQAEQITLLNDDSLRGAGLSRGKVLAIRDLSLRQLNRQIPTRAQMHRMSDEELIDRLSEIRGVGRWTAQMILIFWLGRPDVLPTQDLGVQHGFRILYGLSELPSPSTLATHGESWGPYRSIAAWYLWRVADTAKDPNASADW